MGDFKKLLVWRKAHALAINVHRMATRIRGPGSEGLRNQMIRAALSIPTNIVEGHGQESPRNFARFLGYALNSAAELEQHLLTSHALNAISETEFREIMPPLLEVRKMIYGLRTSLSRPRGGARAEDIQGRARNGNGKGQVDSDSSR